MFRELAVAGGQFAVRSLQLPVGSAQFAVTGGQCAVTGGQLAVANRHLQLPEGSFQLPIVSLQFGFNCQLKIANYKLSIPSFQQRIKLFGSGRFAFPVIFCYIIGFQKAHGLFKSVKPV